MSSKGQVHFETKYYLYLDSLKTVGKQDFPVYKFYYLNITKTFYLTFISISEKEHVIFKYYF